MKTKRRQNPLILTPDNLRKWAFIYLNTNSNINELAINATKYFIPHLGSDTIDFLIAGFTSIFDHWQREWIKLLNNFPKIENKQQLNILWKNFILNVEMPELFIFDNTEISIHYFLTHIINNAEKYRPDLKIQNRTDRPNIRLMRRRRRAGLL